MPSRQMLVKRFHKSINLQKNKGRLLDFGCFCGIFPSLASLKGYECYGLEPLIMAAIVGWAYLGLNIKTGTLREDTYPHDYFDVVTAFQVFEHLVSPAKELEKIRLCLKPGGFLSVEVPNIDTLGVRLLRSKHRHFVEDHVSFFSAKTLGALMEGMGFRIREVYYPTRTSIPHPIAGLIANNVH